MAYQGPTYLVLLPQGWETLTAGTREEQLDALRDFGVRLAAQAAKPVLVTLGATVTTFTPGALYQLWLVALNSKGKSPAGPLQNWTAV